MGLKAEESWFDSRQGQKFLSTTQCSDGLCDPPDPLFAADPFPERRAARKHLSNMRK